MMKAKKTTAVMRTTSPVKVDNNLKGKDEPIELMERLGRGEKIKITKDEAKKRSARLYELLPEVKKKKEEDIKKKEMEERLKKKRE